MSDKVYPCRKETISGTRYLVDVLDSAGDVRLKTSFETEEEVERWKVAMSKNLQLSFRVTPYNWSQEVCIECGQEVY